MAEKVTDASPKIAILTVSDRAFTGSYEDRGGPAIRSYINDHFKPPYAIQAKVVPDEHLQIKSALISFCADNCLVLTTGGTGPAPRDITPEATEEVCQKILPGFGEVMRAVSVQKVSTAILSRQTAGICGQSLIVNLPGSPKAVAECLDAVFLAIPHAVTLAGSKQVLTLQTKYHAKGKMCSECNITH